MPGRGGAPAGQGQGTRHGGHRWKRRVNFLFFHVGTGIRQLDVLSTPGYAGISTVVENGVKIITSIISLELLEDELKAVVQAGDYKSKEEAISHALEVLLAANVPLRINTAVELYRQEKVTLARAAEIAGLELEAFKGRLAEREVPILIDEPPEEVRAGAELIRRRRQVSCNSH